MSAFIDDKIVAGAQDPNVIKEDPIVILTVILFYIFQFLILLVLFKLFISFFFLFLFFSGQSEFTLLLSRSLF